MLYTRFVIAILLVVEAISNVGPARIVIATLRVEHRQYS